MQSREAAHAGRVVVARAVAGLLAIFALSSLGPAPELVGPDAPAEA